jgi:uncharacterized protein
MSTLDSMRRRLSSIHKPPIGIEHLTDCTRLFDMDFLDVSRKHRAWFERVNIAVLQNMAEQDNSHDYAHIQRVVLKAHELYAVEKHRDWTKDMDLLSLLVGAMCHGIGDITYAEEVSTHEERAVALQKEFRKQEKQRDLLFKFLRSLDCPPAVAGPASLMASLVATPRQVQQEKEIVDLCQAYPSLKLLQDADRLDAMGWVGIMRAGTSGNIRAFIRLVDEVLVDYPMKMHTRTARREAERRWAQMVEFRDGVMTQMDCCDALRP